MTIRSTSPNNREIIVTEGDIIVSKTNHKGIIEYANETFCNISGYEEGELLGRPHNIVRHPDMPKCIFYTIWNILSKKEIVTFYSKNKNKFGDFYWVKAEIAPVFDLDNNDFTGYHSTRTAVERDIISFVDEKYKELKSIEESYGNISDGMIEASKKYKLMTLNNGEALFKTSTPQVVLSVA